MWCKTSFLTGAKGGEEQKQEWFVENPNTGRVQGTADTPNVSS